MFTLFFSLFSCFVMFTRKVAYSVREYPWLWDIVKIMLKQLTTKILEPHETGSCMG